MTRKRRDTAPNSGRGQGWDGLLAAVRKSEVRHPQTDDGGIDADHNGTLADAPKSDDDAAAIRSYLQSEWGL